MRRLNGRIRRRQGTRFRLFPHSPFRTPIVPPVPVRLSLPAGSVGPGPSDDRMYVVDPIGKPFPYGLIALADGGEGMYLPPWHGHVHSPALPDVNGHFDYIDVAAPQFAAAHLYSAARFTLDVWEGYFGRPIPWHFADDFDQLELIIMPSLNNARMGWGFLEAGAHHAASGVLRPFSLSFDVIAHEIGHCIVYSEISVPSDEATAGEYFGFHEAAADLTALLAVLHFHPVLDQLLNTTRGNLYTYNELNRFAELSDNEEIRLASNTLTMADFAQGWSKEHDLSRPLTGALFDTLIDIFHEGLLDRGLIPVTTEELSDTLERRPEYHRVIQPLFDEAYAAAAPGFREALTEARDTLGVFIAEAWQRLTADTLTYDQVGRALLDVDEELTGGQHASIIRVNFAWRLIGEVTAGQRLPKFGGEESHAHSTRSLIPNRALPIRSIPLLPPTRRALAR
jgi:hypothetical protein